MVPLRMPKRSLASIALLFALACTNNPYRSTDSSHRIVYSAYATPPKTLDPQVAYSVADHDILSNVYETLLEYHFLRRPYSLIPGLALAIPRARMLEQGRVAYRFRLREGVKFQRDPCFAHYHKGKDSRQLSAADVLFGLMRVADPKVNSPVAANFAKIAGFPVFGKNLTRRRKSDPSFAALRVDKQYAAAGPVEGLRFVGPREFEIVLTEAYPQILYWFAMPFTSPVPWEAVAYYDGKEERPAFAERAVGTGPFVLSRYEKRSRITLSRNEQWYGLKQAHRGAPGATHPRQGAPDDQAAGRLDPQYMGKPIRPVDRVEFYYEKETIPAFTKFLQGYYDAANVIRESFDQVIFEGGLSPDMAARGMRLEKSVEPSVYYLGFNMDDEVVGTKAGARARKLRQAMSLVVDIQEFTRIFTNGRGVPAQTPLPPGIFGYDEQYRNPYRQVDVERAKRLLAEAGYENGVDPKTDKPLRLTFDTGDTSARGRLRYQFFIRAWKRIGIDVELAATNYNEFQKKVARGAYQIFLWGWVADYPDPENFLFLLWSPMSRSRSQGPNTANFSDKRYDKLFLQMRNRDNDALRGQIIAKMRAIIEHERPWVELYHGETYALYQGWLRNVKPMGLPVPTLKYRDVDPVRRARLRQVWNRPVRWPIYVLILVFLAVVVPGVRTFLRERQ